MPVEPSYIPNGFTVYDREESKYFMTIIYQSEGGKEIFYSQDLLTQGEMIIDTEDAIPGMIKIGEQGVTVVKNKGRTTIYWTDSHDAYMIIGSSDNNELLEMAESVIEQN